MEDDGAYGGDYEYMEGRELSSPTKDSIVYVFRWRVKWEQSSDEEVWLLNKCSAFLKISILRQTRDTKFEDSVLCVCLASYSL